MEKEQDLFLPLHEEVFNTLRREILTGELAPGTRLMEIHLAQRLGVSRTPIREAIRMLELEGLVTMIPRKGAMVAQMTLQGMQDVLEVRSALDGLCAELACERISKQSLSQLKEACDRFERLIQTDDPRSIAEADVAFHNIIIEATGNERLIAMVANLSQSMYRYRYEYIKDSNGRPNLVEEHKRIYEAISKGDKETATKVALAHIENQRKAIINQIRIESNQSL